MAPSGVLCTRCKKAPARVYMPSGGRCAGCFTAYVDRSFRASLGRAGHSGGRTLTVAVSGGPCSSALAVLAHRYLASLQRPPDTPPPSLVLVHVPPPPADVRVRQHTASAVRALAHALPGATLTVARVPASELESLASARDASDASLLARAARMRAARASAGGCVLLLGTSATRAAAVVLEAVASGRPPTVGNCEPVRGLPARALVRYARWMLPGVDFVSRGAGGAGTDAPIPDAVARFVAAAADDNPASVHNVVRTAGRLVRPGGRACPLCGEPVGAEGEGGGAGMVCRPCGEILRRARAKGADGPLGELVRMRAAEQRAQIGEFLLDDSDVEAGVEANCEAMNEGNCEANCEGTCNTDGEFGQT